VVSNAENDRTMWPMGKSTVLLLVVAACISTSPAMRSPLREQLAAADTPKVEAAARSCLAKHKWKVDPIGGLSSSGWNIVNARKGKVETEVYIQGPGAHPRVTGGPDYDDVFWTCLGTELGGSSVPEFAR
jgi:hypothetical protein